MPTLPQTPDAEIPGEVVNRRMLSIRQAAEYMGVSHSTIKSWLYDGLLPFVKVGRTVRIPAAAFAAEYIDQPIDAPTDDEIRERLIALVTHTIGTKYTVDSVIRVTEVPQDEGMSLT